MKSLIVYSVVLLSLFSCQKETKPNVLFILVDDLGWTDLGYKSDFYETPHLDELSEQMVVFTNAYASASICSPSRAAIMTGKHPVRLNITDWIPGADPQNRTLVGPTDLNQLELSEISLAEILKENGYSTFFSGKWHLGSEGFYPEEQGFDINLGGHEKGSPPGGYYSPYKNPKLKDGPEGEYLTDRLTDEAIQYLETRDKNPFFLFMSYYTVHTPIQASKKHLQRFTEKLDKLDPSIQFRNEENSRTVINHRNAKYASMLYALDANVGRLITALKERNLYDNTLIVFTSDNGGLSTLENSRKNASPTATLPLRAGKGWLYEGGIRVPLFIKPPQYGSTQTLIDEPVVGHDFYPTILSQTTIQDPKINELDGKDLSPLFAGSKSLDRTDIFWHYPHYHGSGWVPGSALRQGDWKLIEFHETEQYELYNLADDLEEQNDLAASQPEKLESLKARLKEHQEATNAQFAKPNLK